MADHVDGADAPATSSVAERVHRRISDLTPAERKAARLLLANYPVVGLEPLSTFAQRAGVSHPTVLRFVAKLGFSGYPPFQTRLRDELKARLESPLSKRRDPDPAAHAERGDFLTRFAQAVCDNVVQSAAAVPAGEFDAVTVLLADRRRPVYVLGGRFTEAVASYCYMHLRVLRPRVERVSGPPVSWLDYLLDMGRDAVLLVFDVRRYQDDVVRFAHEAERRGACVVLVTDQWLSPAASSARHVLPVRIEVPSNWDSSAAALMLVEALIAAVSQRNRKQFEARVSELEGLRAHGENDG